MATVKQIKATNNSTPYDIACDWSNIDNLPYNFENLDEDRIKANTLVLGEINGEGGKIVFGNTDGDIETHDDHLACIEEIGNDELNFKASNFNFEIDVENGGGQFRVTGGPIIIDAEHYIEGNLAGNADTAGYAENAGSAETDLDGNVITDTYLKRSGGTMTGTIVTPGDDSKGIYPATNNYGFVGSSTNKFYKMYATTFYGALSGNASSATSARSDTTTSTYYLCGATSSTTNSTGTLVKRSTVYVNTSGNLCAPRFDGNLSGNATSATNDSLGRKIDTTYITTSIFDEFTDYAESTYLTSYTDNKVHTAPTQTSTFYLCGPTSGTTDTGTLLKNTKAYVDASGYVYSGGSKVLTADTKVTNITTTSAYYLCGAISSGNTTSSLVKRSTVLVNASGNLYVSSGRMDSAGGFYETSDERLKDYSNKIDVNLDKISKIKKHRFTWKNSENKKEEIGVSAQEIRELYPEIVSENEEGYLSVAYDKLAVVALAAIDKLHQENIELKERIIALENKLK